MHGENMQTSHRKAPVSLQNRELRANKQLCSPPSNFIFMNVKMVSNHLLGAQCPDRNPPGGKNSKQSTREI